MPGLHVKFVYNRAIVLSCFSFSVNKLKRKIYYLAKIAQTAFIYCCQHQHNIFVNIAVFPLLFCILSYNYNCSCCYHCHNNNINNNKIKNNNKNDNNKIITIIIIKLWGTFEFEDVGFIATRTALRNA